MNDDPRDERRGKRFLLDQESAVFRQERLGGDDLAELLLVNGVTPEADWGPNAAAHAELVLHPAGGAARNAGPAYPVGLGGSVYADLSGANQPQYGPGLGAERCCPA